MGETIGIFLIAQIAFLGALFLWLPRVSHRELFFGVTVPGDFGASEAGREILHRYGMRVALVTLCSAALAFWGVAAARFSLALAALLPEIAGFVWAFHRARNSVLPHAARPTTVREASLAPRKIRLPGGWPLQLGPFAILAGAGLYLRAHWQRIPSRFPIHWGLNGQPNGWSTRTVHGVFGPLWFGAVSVALLLLLFWGILHSIRRVHASGTAAEAEIARERRIFIVPLFVEYILAVSMAWTALLPLRAAPEKGPSIALPLGLMVVMMVVLPILFLAHRPTNPAAAAAAEAAPVGDGTEDRYWHAAANFYCNPNDPALWVEKRVGIGYTLNFGHRIAWVIMGAILLFPLLLVAALFLKRH